MEFKCVNCGECCRVFGDVARHLPLFEWEVERYSKIAASKGLKLNFKPIRYLLDEKTQIVFVYLYGMISEPCPFLSNNKCSIYSDRSWVCGQFPLLWTAKYHPGNEFGASCFSECPNFDCKKEFEKEFLGKDVVSKNEIDEYLKETYGSCFEFALKSNEAGRIILEIIEKHDKNGDFKLKEIGEADLKNYRVVGFLEFLNIKEFKEDIERINQHL